MSMLTVTTANSVYQINTENKQMRRLVGTNVPTQHQREVDLEGWKTYLSVDVQNSGLLFVWKVDETDDGVILRRTLTSPIVAMEETP